MFEEVYEIVTESDNFEELKEKLTGLHIDDVAIKNGFVVTAGAQLAREGQDEKVEWMRQLGADVDWIAYGYALTGNHEKQKKYDINCLLDSYLRERGAVTDSSGKTKEYFYGSFFSAFQKSFTQKNDAVHALKSALEGKNVDLSEHLPTLRNGHLGKELRAFVKSGMANALVGTEVTTVSGFVQALQDKVSNQAHPM